MYYGSEDNQNMEYPMRVTPNVKRTRSYGLWTACTVEEGAENEEATFKQVVWHSRALPHLIPTMDSDSMGKRSNARETSTDECTNADSPPL